MKEIFNGNVSKETASMIKEMEAYGGPLGVSSLNLSGVLVLANKDVSSYLPESSSSPMEPSDATNLIGEAFKTMVDNGIEFFYEVPYGQDPSLHVADIQIVYEEGTTNIIGVSFDSDTADEPYVWSASGGATYGADCILFGENPEGIYFDWVTAGE